MIDPEVDKKRLFVVEELVSTERSYLMSLDAMQQLFLVPMRRLPTVSATDIAAVFPQLETIRNFSAQLLESLDTRRAHWQASSTTIGDVFLATGPFLKAHASFVNGHADAVATFERLAVRLPEVQRIASDALLDARSRGQNIQSLLITPVQRIPRYLLLLESLLSRTPEAHPDHALLAGAVKLVRGIASELNESKRNHDDAKLMFAIALHIDPPVDDLIEPHRRLLLDAVLLDVARQKPYRFVLFSDLLIKLSAKKNVFVGQKGKHNLKGIFSLQHARIQPTRDAASTITVDFVDDSNNRKVTSITVRPETEEARLTWLHSLQSACKRFHEHPKSSQYRELPVLAPFDRKNPLTLRGVVQKAPPSQAAAVTNNGANANNTSQLVLRTAAVVAVVAVVVAALLWFSDDGEPKRPWYMQWLVDQMIPTKQ